MKTIFEVAALDYEGGWDRIDALLTRLQRLVMTFNHRADLLGVDRDR